MVKSRQRWYNNPINITDGRFGCSFNGFSRLNDGEDGAVMNIKIDELLAALKKKEEEQDKNTVLWVLAIIGAVAAVAGIAFAVYRFFAPDYLEDFEEDLDDDFDDYFEDEE